MTLAAFLLPLALLGAGPSGCAGVVIGTAATVGVAAAEEKGLSGAIDDTKIRAAVAQKWFEHDHALFKDVSMTVNEGRVLLTGSVPDAQSRVDAVRLAWQAPGVREVINELQTANSGIVDYGRDVVAANSLRGKLLFDKEVRNINYSVDVVNGVVYLMGIAQDQTELDRVTGHARNLANVKRVVSYIMLKDDPRRQRP